MIGRCKITVVGAGNVGATVAQRLAEKNCYDVVLVDIVDGVPQGKTLDLSQAGPICGYDSQLRGATTFDGTDGPPTMHSRWRRNGVSPKL